MHVRPPVDARIAHAGMRSARVLPSDTPTRPWHPLHADTPSPPCCIQGAPAARGLMPPPAGGELLRSARQARGPPLKACCCLPVCLRVGCRGGLRDVGAWRPGGLAPTGLAPTCIIASKDRMPASGGAAARRRRGEMPPLRHPRGPPPCVDAPIQHGPPCRCCPVPCARLLGRAPGAGGQRGPATRPRLAPPWPWHCRALTPAASTQAQRALPIRTDP